MTRAQAMAAIKSSPAVSTPTVSKPTAAPAPAPEPVEGAIRYESTDAKPLDTNAPEETAPEGLEAAPDAALEAEPSLQEIIDYEAKYKEVFDSGDLHQSLLDKMLIAKVDGQEMPVSVKEALAGYQRRSDYSRNMNEVASQRAAVDAERQQIAGMWQAFQQKPELALEIFGERYGDEWIDRVVETRQRAREEYDNSVLGAGYRMIAQLGLDPATAGDDPRVRAAMAQEKARLDNARKLEAENKALKRRQQEIDARAQQNQQAQESQSYQDRFTATVKRFSDAALKAEGLSVNSVNRADLQAAVAQVIIAQNTGVPESKRSYSVTQEVVREAAQILKETKGSAARAQAQEPPLPARQGMGTGTGAPVARTGNGPMTRKQFLESLKKR